MQVYFQSQYDFRKQKKSKQQQDKMSLDLQGLTLNQARHQRFQSKGELDTLTNRCGHLLMQQGKVNQNAIVSKDLTLKTLKVRFNQEQAIIKRKHQKHEQKKLVQEKRAVCQVNRLNQVRSQQEIDQRIKAQKKEKHDQIFEEHKFLNSQCQMIKQKDILENQYLTSVIKEKDKAMKLNIHRFWDFRIRTQEIQKKKMICEQLRNKNRSQMLQQQLKQKEQELRDQLEAAIEKQKEKKKQLLNARCMSTQQFKQLYPSYYDDMEGEIIDDVTTLHNQSPILSTNTSKVSKRLNSSKVQYQAEHQRLTQLVNKVKLDNRNVLTSQRSNINVSRKNTNNNNKNLINQKQNIKIQLIKNNSEQIQDQQEKSLPQVNKNQFIDLPQNTDNKVTNQKVILNNLINENRRLMSTEKKSNGKYNSKQMKQQYIKFNISDRDKEIDLSKSQVINLP